FQTAQAIEGAANNPGGMAAGGMGMGMGFAMAQQMGQSLADQQRGGGRSSEAGPASPPPLPPTTARWFVAIDRQQAGPFDDAALAARIREGVVTRESLVWREGLAAWTPAREVPELGSFFRAGPPPLPPT